MKKVSSVLLTIFSAGVLLSLLAGGLSLIGFIVALFIGGETATELCKFIHKTYFPWVIQCTAVFVAFGLIGMYMNKVTALTVNKPASK